MFEGVERLFAEGCSKMKNPFESSETFQAFAEIEAAYFMIGKMRENMAKPIHPINQQIDIATGFAERQFTDNIQTLIGLFEGIIENKKILEETVSHDLEMIEKLKNLKWKN